MLEPPSTRSAPSTSCSVSTFPIPFWNVIAQPSEASRRSAARAASRVALVSVKTTTRSAPAAAGRLEPLRRFGGGQPHDVLAEHPGDAKPVPADGLDVLAPGVDQAHLLARQREQPAIGSAHRPRSDHHDPHPSVLLLVGPLVRRAAARLHSNRYGPPVQDVAAPDPHPS